MTQRRRDRLVARHALTLFLIAPLVVSCGETTSTPPDYPAGPYGGQVGQTVGDLELLALDGSMVSLSDFRTRETGAILLYATATWCFTSAPEVAWLNQRVTEIDGFVPLAIVTENEQFERAELEDGELFSEALGVSFTTLVDVDGVTSPYRSEGAIPLNLLVEPGGMRIAYRAAGFDADALDGAINDILEDR